MNNTENRLDAIDEKILAVIKENARLSYSDIGDKVGVTRVSVKNRMEAMEKRGVITGYHTIIDETKASDGIRFFLDVEVLPASYETVVELLASSKMIRHLYSVSGDCRIHADGFAPNTRQLEYFSNELYRKDRGVRKISCHTVLATLKDIDGGVEYERYQQDKHLEGRNS